jgi:hypothetical protein
MSSASAIASSFSRVSAAMSGIIAAAWARLKPSVPVTFPRFSRLAASSRKEDSNASNPAGSRSFTSNPRPLTLRSSHTQAVPFCSP